jgi:hypothetical protein
VPAEAVDLTGVSPTYINSFDENTDAQEIQDRWENLAAGMQEQWRELDPAPATIH